FALDLWSAFGKRILMAISEPLTSFVARCDPSAPATPEMYVERAQPVSGRLRDQLSTSRTARVLLVGPPGVGKTTELARFEREMSAAFNVIRPPLETHLDLSIVSWHDLFIFSMLWASERAGLAGSKE